MSFPIITIIGPVVKELHIYERASGKTTLAKKVYSGGYGVPYIIGADDKVYRVGRYKGNRRIHERSKNGEELIEILRALGVVTVQQYATLQGYWKGRDKLDERAEAAEKAAEALKILDIKPGRELRAALDRAQRKSMVGT